ncbi:MAG: hypothetical protein U0V74_12465 [Chitinophagales bacterium]
MKRLVVFILCVCGIAALHAQTGFDAQLAALVAAYPAQFESLKGAKEYMQGDSTRFSWKSKVNLEGAAETIIAQNLPSDKNLTLIVRFESFDDKATAEAFYKLLVQKVKAVSLKCCTLIPTEGKEGLKTFTNFIAAKGTAQKGYENMVIQVKLNDHSYQGGFHFYSVGILIFKKE